MRLKESDENRENIFIKNRFRFEDNIPRAESEI
jgi:hypothetical protein